MMCEGLTEEDVQRALDDALAIVSEHGRGISVLEQFGLEAEALVPALRERIEYHELPPEKVWDFVQGFVEGITTGMKLRLESRA